MPAGAQALPSGSIGSAAGARTLGFTRLTQSLEREDAKVSIEGRDFVVYLFCIPESDYISGQVIVIGGGINL